MDSMDESTVTSPSSGSSPLSLPRSPRPLRVLASGQLHMYMYNMSYDAVDYADALQPLRACVHVSCREDVLRCWPRVMYCRTTCIASSCQCKSCRSDERPSDVWPLHWIRVTAGSASTLAGQHVSARRTLLTVCLGSSTIIIY